MCVCVCVCVYVYVFVRVYMCDLELILFFFFYLPLRRLFPPFFFIDCFPEFFVLPAKTLYLHTTEERARACVLATTKRCDGVVEGVMVMVAWMVVERQ